MTSDKAITWREFFPVICKALGIEDLAKVRRIVIDAEVLDVVKVYVEFLGSERVLSVNWVDLLRIADVDRGGQDDKC